MHFLGHRDRLKKRFYTAGSDALADYELLEMFLFLTLPRVDTKPIAKALLKRFESFDGIIHADFPRLKEIEGVGEKTAHALKVYGAMVKRHGKKQILKKPVLKHWDDILRYCVLNLSYQPIETFYVLFLDKKMRLIHMETQQTGTIDEITIYIRELAKRALELYATNLILWHNHPTGFVEPSAKDIQVSLELYKGLKMLDISLYDHLIVGKGSCFSLREMGIFIP